MDETDDLGGRVDTLPELESVLNFLGAVFDHTVYLLCEGNDGFPLIHASITRPANLPFQCDPGDSLLTLIHAHDRASVGHLLKLACDREQRRPIQVDCRTAPTDGISGYIRIEGCRIERTSNAGCPLVFLKLTDRADERRLSEALAESDDYFQRVMAISDQGILLWNLKTDDVMCNRTLRVLFGMTPSEQPCKPLRWINLCEPGVQTTLSENFDLLVSGGKTRFVAEFQITLADGSKRHLRLRARAERFASKPEHISMVFTDVTASKQAEAKLAEATNQADAGVRAKAEFNANMGHDIRTPLNAILGFGKMLEQHVADNRARKYLKEIHTSSQTLLELFDNAFTRTSPNLRHRSARERSSRRTGQIPPDGTNFQNQAALLAKRELNILVVDDDPVNCELMASMLEAIDANVFKTHSASQALDVHHCEDLDLVLLDVQMPGIDGIEACPMIKSRGCCSPKVILISGDRIHQETMDECQADGHIEKPFTLEEFIAGIARIIDPAAESTHRGQANGSLQATTAGARPPEPRPDLPEVATTLKSEDRALLVSALQKLSVDFASAIRDTRVNRLQELHAFLKALNGQFPDEALVTFVNQFETSLDNFDLNSLSQLETNLADLIRTFERAQ